MYYRTTQFVKCYTFSCLPDPLDHFALYYDPLISFPKFSQMLCQFYGVILRHPSVSVTAFITAQGSHTHLMHEMSHIRPTSASHHLELKLALHMPNLERRVEAFPAGQDQQSPRADR